ncbi:MAG: ribokinase [Gammaproteobacteria bacterium]|nr:ribokinase [Gammaproteobacteria bacterium]
MKAKRNRNNGDVCVLGSINQDVVALVAELPRPGETVVARRVTHYPGGKGANQALAAARMGARTLMIGATGADEAGNVMRAFLQDNGVDTAMVESNPRQPTGQAFINVSAAGENAIVIAAGANATLTAAAIRPEKLAGCGIFLAQLESPVETVKTLFSGAPARRGITILNAAPALPEGAGLFSLTDILVLNESELGAYAQLPEAPTEVEGAITGARKLIGRDGPAVIVTLGEKGAVVVEREQSELIPGRRAQVTDTTGAGDCFCGTLAAALAEGYVLNEAARFAALAASLSVERAGAATSIPTRAEVEKLEVPTTAPSSANASGQTGRRQ